MNNKIPNLPKHTKHLILVEGRDDREVIKKILKKINLESVWVHDLGGYEKLKNNFISFLTISSLESVGIVIDANDNLIPRWKAVADKIDWPDFGTEIVEVPQRNGLTLTRSPRPGRRKLTLGVWLMPDNETSGALEKFLENMIPKEQEWELATKYVERAIDCGLSFNVPKAEIHAWMAIVLPGNLSGTAIDAGKIKLEGEVYERFVGWIQRLRE